MAGSFRRIDYSIRPAKHAERRMLAEVVRRLWPFQPIESYAYVGLGSVWFADFVLFHRMLGIRNMISIERSPGSKERFTANKPFRTIEIDFRESSVALPELDWSNKQILWLDFEDPITKGILFDASTVASRASSGTLLAISVQCQHAREIAEARSDSDGPGALARFRDRFGPARVPSGVVEEELGGWPFGKISRQMIAAEIESALVVRNATVAEEEKVKFHPICDIEYEDGAKMTTTVGLFAAAADNDLVERCGFDHLDFISSSARLRRIRVPKLTIREIRHLDQQLPEADLEKLTLGTIPKAEAESYADLYRYLPNFAVLEG